MGGTFYTLPQRTLNKNMELDQLGTAVKRQIWPIATQPIRWQLNLVPEAIWTNGQFYCGPKIILSSSSD